jgi:hypothetical protein
MSRRLLVAALVMASLTAGSAWAGTKFTTAWKSPEFTGFDLEAGDKVLAMVMTTHEESRHGAEATLAQELEKRDVTAVPAYTVIPGNVVQDKDRAKPYIDKSGCKYAIVMRVAGREKELRGTGPSYTAIPVATMPYYGSFYGGYYTFGWGAVYNPGVMEIQNKVHVETLIYDLRTDKLIWAGMSDTMNPDTAQKFIKDLVKGAAKEMKKQGLTRK